MTLGTSNLLGSGSFSHTGGAGGPNSPNSFGIGHSHVISNSTAGAWSKSTSSPPPPSSSLPNDPLSGAKYVCSVGGD
ncbi:hypothetical protein Cfor_02281 [Coptotermes formosanus]|uniref:Uncharacterized protein n=1 Tax=Coptotermes formosanus TaxID=36987 RepID=A0A6L2QAY2_COPFO|nr:hypothetical protein Cfor_02281 [Coptotermes formosanus]